MPDLDFASIIRVLEHHRVEYIVIGGVSAIIHDLPLPATVDIDITPSRDAKNLGRLALAFDDLDAGLLTADETGTWFPRQPVENWAQYDTLHLMTKYGPLDLVFAPDGAPGGFDELLESSEKHTVADRAVRVISVATWERLKQASGRAKDLEHLDRFYGE